MSAIPESTAALNIQSLNAKFNEMVEFIQSAVGDELAIHKVEETLWGQILRMGYEALSLFIALSGNGDEGETITLPDGQRLKRLKELHVVTSRPIPSPPSRPKSGETVLDVPR